MFDKSQLLQGDLKPGMTFYEKVWALTSRIPAGQVVTYGQIAQAMQTKGYRAVGHALNQNPFAPDVPCHRVVGADGKLTGFGGGLPKKRAMLEAEGVPFKGDRVVLADCRGSL